MTCSLTVKSVSDGCPSRAGSPRLAKSCIAQPFFITGTGVFFEASWASASGKRLHSYGKSLFFMGKSTINGNF